MRSLPASVRFGILLQGLLIAHTSSRGLPPSPSRICLRGCITRSKAEGDLNKQAFSLSEVAGPRLELFLDKRPINLETYEVFREITLCTLVH
jgi:hypothetical protein